MKNVFFFIYSLLIIHYSLAQAPSIQWQRCYGGSKVEQLNFIRQTIDGGYILAGGTVSNDGDAIGNVDTINGNAWIIKVDSMGGIEWQKCYGGFAFEIFLSVCTARDGGYVAAGYTQSNDGDVSGNHGSNDLWMVKIDSIGNMQWQKCHGGTNADEAYIIQQTRDGGYIMVGETISNDGDIHGFHPGASSIPDTWVVKTDSAGNIQWQKCLGGSATDQGVDIQQTFDGGYIVTSKSSSSNGDVTNQISYRQNYWVVKLDSSGSIKWNKCYGGYYGAKTFSGKQTTDEGFILAGYTASNDGDVSGLHGMPQALDNIPDIWVVKTDSGGILQYQKCLGGTDADFDGHAIQAQDGGYVVIGTTVSTDGDITFNHGFQDCWVVKLDTFFNIVWQKCFGGSDQEYSDFIEQTRDGGYIFVASTLSNDGDISGNHGRSDVWVVKLSPDVLTTADIDKEREEKINIFPNPLSTNELAFSYPTLISSATISIFNTDGKEVVRGLTPALSKGEGERTGEAHIKLPKLASGMYFVVLQAGEKRMTGRFVKE